MFQLDLSKLHHDLEAAELQLFRASSSVCSVVWDEQERQAGGGGGESTAERREERRGERLQREIVLLEMLQQLHSLHPSIIRTERNKEWFCDSLQAGEEAQSGEMSSIEKRRRERRLGAFPCTVCSHFSVDTMHDI